MCVCVGGGGVGGGYTVTYTHANLMCMSPLHSRLIHIKFVKAEELSELEKGYSYNTTPMFNL